MILADTSVWLRALAGDAACMDGLSRLGEKHDVVAHDLVYGELLIGDRGGRARMLSGYAGLPCAQTIAHREVVSLVRGRRLHGRGIGWIDAHLLASALAERHRLWTADERLAAVAAELGVGWQPPAIRIGSPSPD
ncbi:MAG: type II toxin-antitoxin system VapC family toxin [Terriglobales bacterium]